MTDSDSGMDLEALRDGVRGVLAEQASHERVAAFTDGEATLNAALWAQASELGWLALSAPEEAGGLGLGPQELAVVYEELGRSVAPLPMLGSMLAVTALTAAVQSEQTVEWIGQLASGERIGTVSMVRPGALETGLTLTAGEGGSVVLDGVADSLLDGASANFLVLLARDGDTLKWVVVDTAADGVAVEAIRTVDRTRSLGRTAFASLSLPADRVLAADAAAIGEAILTHAALAVASDSQGGAEAVLDITLEYLKTRQQFGKPIGSFQALKHRCAEHRLALVGSRHLIAEAVARAARGEADALRYVLSAKALAAATGFRVAEDAVQLHGGIGYTWEHPCHLYLKRARLNEQLFGDEAAHLDHVARLLLAAA